LEEKVGSKIKHVSALVAAGIKTASEGAFEWWGPSFDEARNTMVAKSKALKDKRTSLRKAVKNTLKTVLPLVSEDL
jgi:glutaconate CoA-transferase subunit A